MSNWVSFCLVEKQNNPPPPPPHSHCIVLSAYLDQDSSFTNTCNGNAKSYVFPEKYKHSIACDIKGYKISDNNFRTGKWDTKKRKELLIHYIFQHEKKRHLILDIHTVLSLINHLIKISGKSDQARTLNRALPYMATILRYLCAFGQRHFYQSVCHWRLYWA